MFESSFNAKELPSEWKYANITPLYKKGPRTEVGNYRLVSLTDIVCKLMESIIRDNIMNHFISNRLFSNRQFGFVKGRSTTLHCSCYRFLTHGQNVSNKEGKLM